MGLGGDVRADKTISPLGTFIDKRLALAVSLLSLFLSHHDHQFYSVIRYRLGGRLYMRFYFPSNLCRTQYCHDS